MRLQGLDLSFKWRKEASSVSVSRMHPSCLSKGRLAKRGSCAALSPVITCALISMALPPIPAGMHTI
eukprot:1618067-Amphidinium_carterae.1